jgi:hypothetical protein
MDRGNERYTDRTFSSLFSRTSTLYIYVWTFLYLTYGNMLVEQIFLFIIYSMWNDMIVCVDVPKITYILSIIFLQLQYYDYLCVFMQAILTSWAKTKGF